MVVLLNLLIAIISDTHEKVIARELSSFNYERMKIIHLIDKGFNQK